MEIIRTHILPIIDAYDLFQQNNAPIHVPKYSKNVFNDEKINLLDCSSLSSDLNPIVNL